MAKTIDTLAIKIIADAGDVSQGLGKVTKEVREAARIVEGLASPMDKLAAKESRLNQLFAEGAITQRNYGEVLGRLKGRMDDLNSAKSGDFGNIAGQIPVFGRLFSAITTASGAMMAFNTALHAAEHITIDAGKRIDEVSDQAERLGLTVGALSELKIAAKFADVKDFGAVTGFLEKMQINISKAAGSVDDLDLETKKSADAFVRLKLNANELLGMTLDQKFYKISQALSGISTNDEMLELLKAIGKGGPELATFVREAEKFKALARESNAIITQDQADIIERADESITKLKMSMEGLGNTIAVVTAPAVSGFAKDLSLVLSLSGETIWQQTAWGQVFSPGAQDALDAKARMNARGKPSERTRQLLGMGMDQSGRFIAEGADFEKELRDNAVLSDAQKSINQAKADAAAAKERHAGAHTPEAIQAKKEEDQFTSMEKSLREQIYALEHGAQAAEEYKIATLDMDEGLKEVLQTLHSVKLEIDAKKHAEEMDVKNSQDRIREADAIKHGNLSQKELALERLRKAQDLVTTQELTQGDFDRLLSKEARGLSTTERPTVGAASINSQAAIAATLGRNNAATDSEALQSIKTSLLTLVNKEVEQVDEVASID